MITAPSVELSPLRAGYCRHLEWCSDRGGSFRLVSFPAHCALIRHPERGLILFDTGYSPDFFTATSRFPEKLYRWMLPVTLPNVERLDDQLRHIGISPEQIDSVIVSHLHADHIAGLSHFSRANFFASHDAIERAAFLRGRRWRGLLDGFIEQLLPYDFFERSSRIESTRAIDLPPWMAPFSRGYDLFGDGSILTIPLDGHAIGQIGILLPNAGGRPIFLAADACWSAPACVAGRLPGLPGLLVTASRQRFTETFTALSTLMKREPSLVVLPSHCRHSWNSVGYRTIHENENTS